VIAQMRRAPQVDELRPIPSADEMARLVDLLEAKTFSSMIPGTQRLLSGQARTGGRDADRLAAR
jgi:hypothetical protein